MSRARLDARRRSLKNEAVGAMKRRTLLGLGGAALVAAATPLPLLFARRGKLPSKLVADPRGLLDLPQGFTYRILDRAGAPMSDGHRVPWRPDGMGCFSAADGSWVLMRNHEVGRVEQHGPRGAVPAESFDPAAYGCVTRLVVNPRTLEIRSSNLVLAGTLRNCAGGVSPWGWLSCEESVDHGHGYVFLCRTTAASVERPNRILAFGRFNHEAACVDPATHVTYLTEDRGDSCLYRCVPSDPAHPFSGQLQAMRVNDAPRFEIGERLSPGDQKRIDWVSIPEPNPAEDSVRLQAQERGAALVRRGEGAWFHRGAVYVCSTTGGPREAGQILRITPEPNSTLEVVTQAEDTDLLDMPDNITVAPWGDVYLAEDGAGDQFLRGLSAGGYLFDVARNAHSGGELAGVCFSPDARVLFVNMQLEGLTLAIRGPFESLSKRV
jgi:secreted PhoX family phosphatase